MFITVGDAKIFATAFGSKNAPTILALGGWIGSWEDWIETLSPLSENWRVIAYDHRGSGITISAVETIVFDTLVDDVFAVLDAYEVEECVLAAMSMGAAVALGAALRQPERFSGLVLANPLDMREDANKDDRFLQLLENNYSFALDAFINSCIVEDECEHIKLWGRHILNRASQDAAIALYKLSRQIPIQASLSEVDLATLIIHGDADRVSPLASAEWLAETLPNASLKVIEGAGHVPILTRPDIVTDEIERFFSK